MKKKFKHRLTGRKREQDGTGIDPGGERADSTSSLPQPESHVVVDESCHREENMANAAGEQAFTADQPPQPDSSESAPARGDDNDQEGGEPDVDGVEASQMHSHLNPDVNVAVGSGRSGELEGVGSSPSTPSISEPDST